MTKEELRAEFNKASFKQKLREYHGCRCVNCNSDDRVEYHHIVALADGGTNRITNIVPLCWECHQKAHSSKTVAERHKPERTGRPMKELKNLEENVQLYIDCKIGTRELKERIGLRGNLTDSVPFRRYINSIGIKSVSNNVDLINSKSKYEWEVKEYRAKIDYL